MVWDKVERRVEVKADKLIWYLMVTFMGIIIVGGGGWATSVNAKIADVSALNVNIEYMQTDLSDIKKILYSYIKRGE